MDSNQNAAMYTVLHARTKRAKKEKNYTLLFKDLKNMYTEI